MTYIDGFVIAVPTANRQAFIDHVAQADNVFPEMSALRVVPVVMLAKAGSRA